MGFLSSDESVDHQLLIQLRFREPVKLSALRVRGRSEDGTAPQEIRIFQGKDDIGFQEAEDEEPTQILLLTSREVDDGEPAGLRFVKFQAVSSLQLFVESNFGAPSTRIARLEFLGAPAQ